MQSVTLSPNWSKFVTTFLFEWIIRMNLFQQATPFQMKYLTTLCYQGKKNKKLKFFVEHLGSIINIIDEQIKCGNHFVWKDQNSFVGREQTITLILLWKKVYLITPVKSSMSEVSATAPRASFGRKKQFGKNAALWRGGGMALFNCCCPNINCC